MGSAWPTEVCAVASKPQTFRGLGGGHWAHPHTPVKTQELSDQGHPTLLHREQVGEAVSNLHHRMTLEGPQSEVWALLVPTQRTLLWGEV